MSNKKLTIPFFILNGSTDHMPVCIDPHMSIYALYARDKYYLNPNSQLAIKTGIAIDATAMVNNNSSLHINVLSSPHLTTTKGIVLLTPTVITPFYTNELSVVMWNITKEVKTIDVGEELCLVEFSVTQPVELYRAQYNNVRQQKYDF